MYYLRGKESISEHLIYDLYHRAYATDTITVTPYTTVPVTYWKSSQDDISRMLLPIRYPKKFSTSIQLGFLYKKDSRILDTKINVCWSHKYCLVLLFIFSIYTCFHLLNWTIWLLLNLFPVSGKSLDSVFWVE